MKRFAAAALILALTAVVSADVRIPLTVNETTGNARPGIPVTSGVPLLPGQVKDVNKLALLDAEGNVVPCQFRPLARWWRDDGSIRWVLLDFKASVAPFGQTTYYLTDSGAKPQAASPLKVEQTDDAITVTTGPARFVISRKHFNLFDSVRLDINADGQFADDEQAVSPSPDNGSVVTDTYGVKYYSAEGTESVEVTQAGPVKVRVIARGIHRARGGKGYSHGMYGYEIRMDFYAGLNTVMVDALLTNNGPNPNGSPTFEDHSIICKVNMGAAPAKYIGDSLKPTGPFMRMYGQAPVMDVIPAGQSRVLYQDSVGSENWQVSPGLEGPEVDKLSTFRGYRILSRAGGKETVLHQGDQARGLVDFGGPEFGVTILPRDFWQQFPKAIEAFGDGTARVANFPAEYSAVHWLEDATASGLEFALHFYARKQKPQWARDTSSKEKYLGYQRARPWPHVVDDFLTASPLFARATPEHYAACGALADVGPYLAINAPHHDYPLPTMERRWLMTDYLKGNAYGWQTWGCWWEEFAGHSPWNYEPIGSSRFLYEYLNSGGPNLLTMGRRRFRQFRDIRAFLIDGTNPFGYASWDTWHSNNVAEDYANRRDKWPKGDEVEKYTKGRYQRRSWYAPNPAHCNLDDLYHLYCLFGDERAMRGMKQLAAYGGAYVGPGRNVGPHRATGWCFRTIAGYYELTGDEDALKYYRPAVDNFWDLARRERSSATIKYNNDWFMDVFMRSVVVAWQIDHDERLRDLVIGLTRGRTKKMHRWHTANAFCYWQTGREEYFDRNWQSYARLRRTDYYPACSGWLWKQAAERTDRTAPAAVADLSATAAGGVVTLTWTAPGDDAGDGTAAAYQVKYDDQPVVETATGKGESNFWAAINLADEPAPAGAGTKQTMQVKGLAAGTYYFALKARDEDNNESDLSNVAKVEVK